MELTPEERAKIYEEEKAREEARKKVQAETEIEKKKKDHFRLKGVGCRQGCMVFLLVALVIFIWMLIQMN